MKSFPPNDAKTDMHVEKSEHHYLTSYKRINLRWIIDLKVHTKVIKLVEEIIEEFPKTLCVLGRTHNALITKRTKR